MRNPLMPLRLACIISTTMLHSTITRSNLTQAQVQAHPAHHQAALAAVQAQAPLHHHHQAAAQAHHHHQAQVNLTHAQAHLPHHLDQTQLNVRRRSNNNNKSTSHKVMRIRSDHAVASLNHNTNKRQTRNPAQVHHQAHPQALQVHQAQAHQAVAQVLQAAAPAQAHQVIQAHHHPATPIQVRNSIKRSRIARKHHFHHSFPSPSLKMKSINAKKPPILLRKSLRISKIPTPCQNVVH